MTTPSLCNSFFKKYLIYKLRGQLIPFIICSLLNMILLPPLVMSIPGYMNINIPYELEYLIALAAFFMALTGAPRAFTSCVKANSVDTLGSLPLTRKQIFAADFLSGYIANVAPAIPCSIFTVIFAACANARVSEDWGLFKSEMVYFKFFTIVALALFGAYSFAYILSVFVTVCCGKTSSSIIFSILITVLLMIVSAGFGGYTEFSSLTSYADDYIFFIPPFGPMLLANSKYRIMESVDLSEFPYVLFDLPSPLLIIVYILIGAAVIYASYRVFKSRRFERTGRVISSVKLYRVILALSIAAIFGACFGLMYNFPLWLPLLISFALTAILIIVVEAIRGMKKASLLATGVHWLITFAVCFAAILIIDGTGSFGARYINVPADDVRFLTVSRYPKYTPYNRYDGMNTESLTFTDSEDIEQFLTAHNSALKKYKKGFRKGSGYTVELRLKNGTVIQRFYSGNEWILTSDKAMKQLDYNVESLAEYNEKASKRYKALLDSYRNIEVCSLGEFGQVHIPEEVRAEFADTFVREFREKHTPLAETAGTIRIYSSIGNEIVDHTAQIFLIPESCTETLAMAHELRADAPESSALAIECYRNYRVRIRYELDLAALNSERGQELFSLMSEGEAPGSKELPPNRFEIYSSDLQDYYVPDENSTRFLNILLDIIENDYQAQ